MLKHTCLLILVVQALGISSAFSQSDVYPDSARLDFSSEVQSLIYNDRFASADSLCDLAISSNPDDPLGYVFRLTGWLAQMTDAEENTYSDNFTDLVDTVEALVDSEMESLTSEHRAWWYLHLGHARACRSLYEARFGSFLKAIKYGMSARGIYQEGLEADSSVYDLYFGLGSYHYWKSARAGILRWLLLFKDEKEKGIAELKLAADSAVVFSDAAQSALIWVWLNEGKYDSAIAAAENMYRRFPDGRSFLWPLAQALTGTRQYRRALETYQQLRISLAEAPGNYFNLIECDFQITESLEKLRLTSQAAEAARRLHEYESLIPDGTRQRQRSRLEYLQRLSRL